MAKIPAVLVVDQDAKARYDLKRVVKQSNFVVAGEAGFGTEAVSMAVELKPDVVLLGMREPVVRSHADRGVAAERPAGDAGHRLLVRRATSTWRVGPCWPAPATS